MLINTLKDLNYFKYNSAEEKKKFEDAIKRYGSNRKNLNKLINQFTFKYDYRTYLIDESIDDDILLIDKNGRDDKWEEFALSSEYINNGDFNNFLETLGLSISYSELILFDENSEVKTSIIIINNTEYKIQYPYLKEEILLSSFAETINKELIKVNAQERCYLIDRYPTIMIFISEEIYKYLIQLESDNGFEILKPEKWIQKFITNYNLR